MEKSLERSKILLRKMQKEPLILTLQLKAENQEFFNAQRKQYFPPERNFLEAHLTLFHQLPPRPETSIYLSGLQCSPFEMMVTGLLKLGGGIGYRIESKGIESLHQELKAHFQHFLLPQDLQPFRPHITIQNKVTPEKASFLFKKLSKNFESFIVTATGLQLWTYLGGPWRFERTFDFKNQVA